MGSLTVRRAALLAFVVGLGWTLGLFLGSFIQYLVTTFAINPVLSHLVG
jgi:hypothetical protein